MGCDIHTIARVKTQDGWKNVARNIGDEVRNYHAFSVLADVRNGRGVAGRYTGEQWEPIAQPRGLPADLARPEQVSFLNDDTILDGNVVWLGDHSHSYLTLKEILDYYQTKMEGKLYLSEDGRIPATEAAHYVLDCISDLKNLADQYEVGYDDIQLVFGFDS